MELLQLSMYDYKDIQINDDIVLHINRNDEGYSFDLYSKATYDSENYDEGYIGGTQVFYSEIIRTEE